jgi:long-chain acyl-CoA synthetase
MLLFVTRRFFTTILLLFFFQIVIVLLYLFFYRSGTTGTPKGAILTHENMIADASNAKWGNLNVTSAEVHLSYLPLAHIFEQLIENAIFMEGGSIGFYQGDTLKLMDDIAVLRPTIFPSVPRLFNRIYDRITGTAQAAGGIKSFLFNTAFADKKKLLKENINTHSIWDSLVFGPIKKRVGLDRVRLIVSGSAPLSAHVMEFLRIVFGCQVAEGYGQTECGGACSVTDPYVQLIKD